VMILNASHVGVEVTLPERVKGCWNIEINTAARDGSGCHLRNGRTLSRNAGARSLVLLRGSSPAT
jgi:hypothetical protein